MFSLFWPRKSDGKRKMYSVEVEGEKKEGETKPRRHYMWKGEDYRESIPGIESLFDIVLHGKELSQDGPCMGVRHVKDRIAGPYMWDKYSECIDRMTQIGAGLIYYGMERGDRVGIYCTNRKEWVIVQFACYLYGLVAVPIYDTFSIESIEIVMKQTEIKILSTTADKVVSLLENSYRFPHLQRIIVLDSISDNLAKIGGSYPHIELTEIGAVETDGMSNPEPRPKDIGHDTLASINYTSGTSDLPTAVQLTHGNYLAVIAIFTFATKDASMLTLTTQDVHFSYLPMQHVLEQIVVAAMLYSGACIGFYQGDIKKIMEDLLELKPTVLVGPPRVFTKIYDGIFAKIAEKGWFATQLFKRALESKKPYVKKGYLHHSLWDALVFNKFKDALGGRVRTFLSGGAPLPSHIPFFFKSAFKANMNEGYGQTETTGALTVTTPQDFSSDSVGPPCPFLHIKLLDVPEMGYTSKDKPYPRGEICVKGPSVTSGYYRNPEKTAENLMADGWLKTGDIGCFDKQGKLRIIDRKRNIFKLANGDYIIPERIENVYLSHPLVSQIFVVGDSKYDYCVAFVVPDPEPLKKWAEGKGFRFGSLKEYCEQHKIQKELLGMLMVHGREGGLKHFEIPKKIKFLPESFSCTNNLMTPTMKLRRLEAKRQFKDEIEHMYRN